MNKKNRRKKSTPDFPNIEFWSKIPQHCKQQTEKQTHIMGIVREYLRIKEVQIPFMEGRPKRDTVISADEILDFLILLNTEKDFDVFVLSL